MRSTLLYAVLSAAALSACSADADPVGPSAEPVIEAASRPSAGTADDVADFQDALDRIATSLDGAAAGTLRSALQQTIAATRSADAAGRRGAIGAALRAVDNVELEGGAAVAAEAEAIRLVLLARQ
jgi:hypothetical protein